MASDLEVLKNRSLSDAPVVLLHSDENNGGPSGSAFIRDLDYVQCEKRSWKLNVLFCLLTKLSFKLFEQLKLTSREKQRFYQ